jgi:hypothetical protein
VKELLSAAFSSSVTMMIHGVTLWNLLLGLIFTLKNVQISAYEMKVKLCVKFVFLKIYILLIIYPQIVVSGF